MTLQWYDWGSDGGVGVYLIAGLCFLNSKKKEKTNFTSSWRIYKD